MQMSHLETRYYVIRVPSLDHVVSAVYKQVQILIIRTLSVN